MSKIQAALVAVAAAVTKGFDASSFKDRAKLREAIVRAANDMSNDQWADLSTEAQDWFNAAADSVKAGKTPDEFPDYAAEPAPRSRNRAEEPKAAAKDAGGKSTAVEDIEEGQRVRVTYKKRGSEKTVTGEVIEVSKRKAFLVVKDADDEHEIDYDAVTATEVFHGDAGAGTEDAGDAAPVVAVGATVRFTNKRGKDYEGVVTQLTDEFIELDGKNDCDLDRIDGDIEVVKAAPAAETEKPSGRRSAAAEPAAKGKDPEPPAETEKPKRSSNPKGVSVGARIRDLMAEEPDRSMESVGKVLEKDGIEFRPATLEMIFKDCVYLIGKLREEKQMKAK